MEPVFRFRPGTLPLLVSIPHAGRSIPGDVAAAMTGAGHDTPDTDFFVDRLYGFAAELGAGVLAANCSRYVADLNRPTDGASLYPGRFTTGLCPVTTFDGQPIYLEGREPGAEEIGRRVEAYWRPYHEKLTAELARLKARFGFALLWDAHSIKSRVPSLFEGRLPDYSIGTNGGESCSLPIADAFRAPLAGKTSVFNGRFKGGFITRNYGTPATNVHAVQLELVQAAYMDEAENRYDPVKAEGTAAVIRALLEAYLKLGKESAER